MKRTILATVAAAALCMPALAQQGQPQNQQPQAHHQMQTQGNAKAPRHVTQSQQDQNKAQAAQSGGIQQIRASNLNDNQVREIQQALDNKGFNVGTVDGKWGPETRAALQDFQKAKNINANGRLDSMTVAALGLHMSDFGMQSGTTGQAPSGSAPPRQTDQKNVNHD